MRLKVPREALLELLEQWHQGLSVMVGLVVDCQAVSEGDLLAL